jgi:tRNA U34 5-methylaminomethyl-2-thiouridine-forming methyltransferase MnmC
VNGAPYWRPARTDDGSWTLLHPLHGEACHSLAGALTQARERYASQIAARAADGLAGGRLRLLDIGTGLALNLSAALEACESQGLALEAVSLEWDLEVPRSALLLAREHGPASPAHARVLAALERVLSAAAEGAPELPLEIATLAGHGASTLRLVAGDARATLPALDPGLAFDVVFLDPFSPRVDPPLWEEPFLAEVARRMAPLARLSTYTTSMRVRSGLVRAGLAVGAGPRVGRKAEGTLASRGGTVPPLAGRIQRRLERARLRPAP